MGFFNSEKKIHALNVILSGWVEHALWLRGVVPSASVSSIFSRSTI